jgi:hypothetical protein
MKSYVHRDAWSESEASDLRSSACAVCRAGPPRRFRLDISWLSASLTFSDRCGKRAWLCDERNHHDDSTQTLTPRIKVLKVLHVDDRYSPETRFSVAPFVALGVTAVAPSL